jgi:hypothetical protein
MALTISHLMMTPHGEASHSIIMQHSVQKPPFGSTATRLIPKETAQSPVQPNGKLTALKMEKERKFQELTEQIHRDTQVCGAWLCHSAVSSKPLPASRFPLAAKAVNLSQSFKL